MVSNKFKTQIYLERSQKKDLDKLSAKTGAPVAELIRRAIDLYLHERRKEIQ